MRVSSQTHVKDLTPPNCSEASAQLEQVSLTARHRHLPRSNEAARTAGRLTLCV